MCGFWLVGRLGQMWVRRWVNEPIAERYVSFSVFFVCCLFVSELCMDFIGWTGGDRCGCRWVSEGWGCGGCL